MFLTNKPFYSSHHLQVHLRKAYDERLKKSRKLFHLSRMLVENLKKEKVNR